MATKIIKCDACGADISNQAEKCPHCGHPNKKFKKKTGCFTLIIAAFFGLVIIVAIFAPDTEITPPATIETPPPATTVETSPPPEKLLETTASELARAYNENTVSADEKFKGVKFKITGKVTEIKTDILGSPYLELNGGINPYMNPQFKFDNEESAKLATLKKGSKVTLICTGQGDMVKIPMSDDCELIN
jgi:ribosomal protein L40E